MTTARHFGVQAEGAAAGEKDGVHTIDQVLRPRQVGLARAGCTTRLSLQWMALCSRRYSAQAQASTALPSNTIAHQQAVALRMSWGISAAGNRYRTPGGAWVLFWAAMSDD